MCAQFIETTTPEGDWRSKTFINPESYELGNGLLYKHNNGVGVVWVAEKIDPTTGCRLPLTVDPGGICVLVYHCEKIRVPKNVGSGTAIQSDQAIYWSGVYGDPVTNVYASGLLWIGMCVLNAADDDASVLIDLHGNHPLAQEAP